MTQEDKELLLRDLSARLPYGVYAETVNELGETHINRICSENINLVTSGWFKECKPYLRPMSSMTEEEIKEYKHLVAFSGSPDGAANFVDWLNKKMFAYRTIDGKDMFELGLALQAPDGMYK